MREVLGASDDEVVELVRQETLDEDEGLDDPVRQAGFAVVARGAVAEWEQGAATGWHEAKDVAALTFQ